jgi:hypothetical protein
MNQQNERELSPAYLRQVAHFVEATALDALADYSDISFPLVVGDVKDFPRASAENRAAERGLEALRESTERVAASLYALAAARDHGREVPEALLAPLRGYIDAYRANGGADSEAEGDGKDRPRRRRGRRRAAE